MRSARSNRNEIGGQPRAVATNRRELPLTMPIIAVLVASAFLLVALGRTPISRFNPFDAYRNETFQIPLVPTRVSLPETGLGGKPIAKQGLVAVYVLSCSSCFDLAGLERTINSEDMPVVILTSGSREDVNTSGMGSIENAVVVSDPLATVVPARIYDQGALRLVVNAQGGDVVSGSAR